MKTVLTVDSDVAMRFGKEAFQIMMRESAKSILVAAVFGGGMWLCYSLFGSDTAFGIAIIVVPMALFGIPMVFAEAVRGGIANLLMGKVSERFLGLGPEPTKTADNERSD